MGLTRPAAGHVIASASGRKGRVRREIPTGMLKGDLKEKQEKKNQNQKTERKGDQIRKNRKSKSGNTKHWRKREWWAGREKGRLDNAT